MAKFLSKWLTETLQLPNIFIAYNSTQLAHDLKELKIADSYRLITPDMKDLYVNTPSEETIHVSKALLTNNKNR